MINGQKFLIFFVSTEFRRDHTLKEESVCRRKFCGFAVVAQISKVFFRKNCNISEPQKFFHFVIIPIMKVYSRNFPGLLLNRNILLSVCKRFRRSLSLNRRSRLIAFNNSFLIPVFVIQRSPKNIIHIWQTQKYFSRKNNF